MAFPGSLPREFDLLRTFTFSLLKVRSQKPERVREQSPGSLCSPGHSLGDPGFGGSRLLKKLSPRFFDLDSYRRERFTVLFYVVLT